ncbi:MAG: metallophosphoesterase, partial [Verrucomicrobia subdivision 3 bacterium]|nr:metallophosphoesterase [Limisphaerales bacterium]
ETVPDQLRAAVLGDWGTGLYGAPVCAQSIVKDAAKYQFLLHLGDVYYSGTDAEVAERFLALWPKVDGALNRALNSNHEMYTGGHAYFQQTLRQFGQKASYFALQNKDWLLVGLDTAYDDHDLRDPQADWLRGLLANNHSRRLVLFSHHQPFSLLDGQGPKLVEKLAEFLKTGRIFAWYWGHEHRCVIYDRHPTWRFFGRCVGHSGYPYFREPVREFKPDPEHPGWLRIPARNMVPLGIVLDGSNRHVVGHEDEYGPNGYMTLEFDGPRLTEFVHSAEGDIVYKKTLT